MTERNESNSTSVLVVGEDAMGTVFYLLVILLFSISLYVFLVMCVYMHRFLQKRRRSRAASVTLAGKANGFGRIALSMRFVALAISSLCLVHFIVEQVHLFVHPYQMPMKKFGQLAYACVMMLGYLFFWLRQRVLYDAPAMRLFTSPILRTLSWLSLGFVVLNSVAQIVLLCVLHEVENPTWIYLSWLVGCLLVQGTLMTLFLYPLIKHRTETKTVFGYSSNRMNNGQKRHNRTLGENESNGVGHGIRDSNIFTVSAFRTSNGSTSSIKRRTLADTNPMYRAARRCVVCAAIAFVSDIIAGGFLIINFNYLMITDSKVLPMFIFDFNLVVNSIFVIGCFSNWRYILLPKCYPNVSAGEKYIGPALPEAVIRQRSLKVKQMYKR